ncbi:unnamed protein product [Spirodela intermedia]|uniref:Uncharacterized protein n=1 Tax=Spirodela intermedia TaxID=51605 RepID=A0A7I8L292_SPIIN|nr:unnamed protein product [Spirodela intermedia]
MSAFSPLGSNFEDCQCIITILFSLSLSLPLIFPSICLPLCFYFFLPL